MKHTTYYVNNGKRKLYTTIALTAHHEFLCNRYEGKTYSHADNAKLWFSSLADLPLVRPIPFIEEITHG